LSCAEASGSQIAARRRCEERIDARSGVDHRTVPATFDSKAHGLVGLHVMYLPLD